MGERAFAQKIRADSLEIKGFPAFLTMEFTENRPPDSGQAGRSQTKITYK